MKRQLVDIKNKYKINLNGSNNCTLIYLFNYKRLKERHISKHNGQNKRMNVNTN